MGLKAKGRRKSNGTRGRVRVIGVESIGGERVDEGSGIKRRREGGWRESGNTFMHQLGRSVVEAFWAVVRECPGLQGTQRHRRMSGMNLFVLRGEQQHSQIEVIILEWLNSASAASLRQRDTKRLNLRKVELG